MIRAVLARQQASLTGSGTFSIQDEAGELLVATVTWKDVITVGTGGVINMNGQMNLAGVTYSGANADLLQLLISGDGAATITPVRAGAPALAAGGRRDDALDGLLRVRGAGTRHAVPARLRADGAQRVPEPEGASAPEGLT